MSELATDKQVKFLRSLLNEREIPESVGKSGEDRRATALKLLSENGYTKLQASKSIEWLLTLPKRADAPDNPVGRISVFYEEVELDSGVKRVGYVVGAGEHRVPRGRYAIETPGDEFANDTTFIKVWVGERGGWNLSIQASDEEYRVTEWGRVQAIIKQIAADPEAAMSRYGRELGKCGLCGRTLTNDESRERGIGPVCAGRM